MLILGILLVERVCGEAQDGGCCWDEWRHGRWWRHCARRTHANTEPDADIRGAAAAAAATAAAAADWDAADRDDAWRGRDSDGDAHGDQERVACACAELRADVAGVVSDQSGAGDEQPGTGSMGELAAGEADVDGWRGVWAHVGCVGSIFVLLSSLWLTASGGLRYARTGLARDGRRCDAESGRESGAAEKHTGRPEHAAFNTGLGVER